MLMQQQAGSNAEQVLQESHDVSCSERSSAASASGSLLAASVSTAQSRPSGASLGWQGVGISGRASEPALAPMHSHALCGDGGGVTARELQAAGYALTGDARADRDIVAFYTARQRLLGGQ